MRICVYCASVEGIDPRHVELAAAVGRGVAERGWELVSGGGKRSMMGAVAAAARAGGARTTGVIPRALVDLEWADRDSDELLVVDTMRERKALMEERADAFLTLPGGLGTFDELFEALTLVQTQKVTQFPVVLVGTAYWSGLLEWIKGALLDGGKISAADVDLISVTDDVAEAVRVVREADQRREGAERRQRSG